MVGALRTQFLVDALLNVLDILLDFLELGSIGALSLQCSQSEWLFW